MIQINARESGIMVAAHNSHGCSTRLSLFEHTILMVTAQNSWLQHTTLIVTALKTATDCFAAQNFNHRLCCKNITAGPTDRLTRLWTDATGRHTNFKSRVLATKNVSTDAIISC